MILNFELGKLIIYYIILYYMILVFENLIIKRIFRQKSIHFI